MEKALYEIEQLSPSDLIAYINDCINHDFNKLVQLLYRIDVSEQKLKTILQSHPNEDAAKLIAKFEEMKQEELMLKYHFLKILNLPQV